MNFVFDLTVSIRKGPLHNPIVHIHDRMALIIETTNVNSETILKAVNIALERKYSQYKDRVNLHLTKIDKSVEFNKNTDGSILYAVRNENEDVVIFVHNRVSNNQVIIEGE